MIPAATTMLMMPDTRFGAYEVQALIGRGGMSEVYRARDVRLNREVAVKVIVRTEDAPPPRVRVVLGWDQDVTRLGQENRAGQ